VKLFDYLITKELHVEQLDGSRRGSTSAGVTQKSIYDQKLVEYRHYEGGTAEAIVRSA
jgi:hypothetical protein